MLANSFTYIGVMVENFKTSSWSDKVAIGQIEVTLGNGFTLNFELNLNLELNAKSKKIDTSVDYVGKQVIVSGFNSQNSKTKELRQVITDIIVLDELLQKERITNGKEDKQ